MKTKEEKQHNFGESRTTESYLRKVWANSISEQPVSAYRKVTNKMKPSSSLCSGMTVGIKKPEEAHTKYMETHFDHEDSQAVDQVFKEVVPFPCLEVFSHIIIYFTIIESPEQPVLT